MGFRVKKARGMFAVKCDPSRMVRRSKYNLRVNSHRLMLSFSKVLKSEAARIFHEKVTLWAK